MDVERIVAERGVLEEGHGPTDLKEGSWPTESAGSSTPT
jgi:hypothetical protein